jgi:hypothetical protein
VRRRPAGREEMGSDTLRRNFKTQSRSALGGSRGDGLGHPSQTLQDPISLRRRSAFQTLTRDQLHRTVSDASSKC